MEEIEQWLYRGEELSGETENRVFCEALREMMEQMRKEGEDEEAIRKLLLSMADEFIGVAQSFKMEFAGGR